MNESCHRPLDIPGKQEYKVIKEHGILEGGSI